MRRIFTFFVSLAFAAQGIVPAAAQDYPMGLKEAPPERYGSLPQSYSPLYGGDLPSEVDLSTDMPPPGRQVGNSCVGWATAYALKTSQEKKERGWSITDSNGALRRDRVFSPHYVYNQINGDKDEGSDFVDAFHVMRNSGVAPISLMSEHAGAFAPIPAAARDAAAPYRIDRWETVPIGNAAEFKTRLALGFPIVIGAKIWSNFESLPAGGIWRGPGGEVTGRHAMVVVGYDDARGAFKVINSWGQDWSSGGFGWIAYDMVPVMVEQAFIVVDLDGVDAGPVDPTEPVVPADPWTVPESPVGNASITVAPFCNGPACASDTGLSHPTFLSSNGQVGVYLFGRIDIPPGVRGVARVVIPLTFANGAPVGSLFPMYSLPSGQAAFGTPPLPLNGNGLSTTWFAFIPYCAMGVPKNVVMGCVPPGPIPPWAPPPAQSDLVATPVLFIDNFGVSQGSPVPFFVRL